MRAGTQALLWLPFDQTDPGKASKALSTDNDAYSLPLDVTSKTGFSIQIFLDPAWGGSAELEVSNDGVHWELLAGSTKVVGTSHAFWNVSDAFYAFVRVQWYPTGAGGGNTSVVSGLLVAKQ